MGYYELFFATPDYLVKFWLSLLLAVGAVVGQVVISCMGGFAFAFYDFPGKRILFGLLCFFMLVPLQVTLLPNYLLLDAFGLLNTYWALLLPLAFAPLGTFLLTQIFRSVPADILQAARLDGAGTLQVLARVLLPCGKSGVSTLIILTLIESWNMVEQPLIYLRDVGSYPLSVFLASRYMENLPFQFVCSVLSLLPLALCFLYFGGDLLQGAGRKGMPVKRVVKNTAFAALLVLTLCTIAAYHIEQLMMAKVTVSVPQDEIVRGVFYEGTVLPLSSLTMRDGNTGVYIIDYVMSTE